MGSDAMAVVDAGLRAIGVAGLRVVDCSVMPTLVSGNTNAPVAMIADAIRDVSGRGEIVLDLFGGSGSTLIAAEKTGRRGYLCEIDPAYADLILARWEDYAKDEAVLLERAEGVAAEAGDGGTAR